MCFDTLPQQLVLITPQIHQISLQYYVKTFDLYLSGNLVKPAHTNFK